MSWFGSWFADPIDEYAIAFERQMAEIGRPVRIGEKRRSDERQRELYAQGRTLPGPIVTWTLHSAHVSGRAFDFDFVSALDQVCKGGGLYVYTVLTLSPICPQNDAPFRG